jgi:DNA polymerase-3 subunit delta'
VSAPVFSSLVGQELAISALERALNSKTDGAGQEMTHAWLFTGPPGSGRSNIAKAFAAALVCKEAGCGECSNCITALAGTHPDVELVDVNGLSIKIEEIREIVTRSSWGASNSKWRVIVIEDSDRMTEAAANALLKALEEPGVSTIWLLCAPTLHDLLPTIGSRCRHLNLKTPTKAELKNYLLKSYKVTEEEADLVANISQGHIGKAKAFLVNDEARSIRKKVYDLIFSVKSEGDAIRAAATLLNFAQERVDSRFAPMIEAETKELKSVMQSGGRGMISGGSKALKDLEKDQKARATRATKDELDGYLLDYITLFRDCLSGSETRINSDLSNEIEGLASRLGESSINDLVSRLSELRELLTTNASQALLLESFFTHYARINRGN